MQHRIGILAAIAVSIYFGPAVFLATIIGATAILIAHGVIIRLTWRITDSVQGRLWLSFGVVMIATIPAQLDVYPAWVAMALVLACTAAFYVALERILQPVPHRVRMLTAKNGKRVAYVDNKKPVGYQWMNQRHKMIGANSW